MTAVVTFPQVVGAHNGPYMCSLYSLFKRIQVDLVEGTLRHVDVDRETVNLLVVQYEMFQTAGDAVLLGSLDVRHYYFTSQVGVFTHILKGASVHRRALDVDTGPQHNILASESKLLTDSIAVGVGKVTVPRGCQAGERREGHDIVVGPFRWTPGVPFQFFAYPMGAVVHIQLSDA